MCGVGGLVFEEDVSGPIASGLPVWWDDDGGDGVGEDGRAVECFTLFETGGFADGGLVGLALEDGFLGAG